MTSAMTTATAYLALAYDLAYMSYDAYHEHFHHHTQEAAVVVAFVGRIYRS